MGQYVREDKIKSSAHVESFVSAEDIKNGQFVELGAIDEELGGEVVAVTKSEKGKKPEAIVLTVHVNKGYVDYKETEQVTKAGKAGRAVILEKGDVLSFLEDIAGAGALVVGDEVTVAENGLGIAKAELEEEVIGKVIGLEYMPNVGDLVVVRFK